MSEILLAIGIRLLSWVVEKLGVWIAAMVSRWVKDKKIEGDAAADLVDLDFKKRELELAKTEVQRAKALADVALAASRFGRLRV